MIQVIDINKPNIWNETVKKFENWDIYYTNEYAKSLEIHGDGHPFLVYWGNTNQSMCFVVIKEDIAESNKFNNLIEINTYYDASTPYGYGGPLIKGTFDKVTRQKCIYEICELLEREGIVSVFFRFHPLLANQSVFEEYVSSISMKSTVYIETNSIDKIWDNMDGSHRNMIRKAKKNDIKIIFDKGERIDTFIDIYNETMNDHTADNYYYFEKDYYKFLIEKMQDNIIFAYAILNEKIISASIFFYNDKYMHYHLSGTLKEYRKYASSNLLLYEAAKWAANNGIDFLHLGGGIGNEDSLFKFKKKFNKKGIVPYYIGRLIVNEEKYNYLLDIRQQNDYSFDINNSFMIQYRK